MTTLRVAAVQASCVLMDRDATIDRVAGLTAEAARDGARLAVTETSGAPASSVATNLAAGNHDLQEA